MSTGVDEFFREGFLVCRLDLEGRRLLAETLSAAESFFGLDEDLKNRDHFPGRHLGYRAGGIEYSATPDRPDLNDSLNLSHGWREETSETSAAMPFYRQADGLLHALDRMTQALLHDVAKRYPGTCPVPETIRHSWLQVNYYRPFPVQRDTLQDRHEDGHLVTIWHSRQPGLEIFPDGADQGTPMRLDDEHVLVMPGSLLTMLTGGDVAPLEHCVVPVSGAGQRMSLMYFVNPTTKRPLYPYKPGFVDATTDIAAVGASNPEKFGLPVLD